MTNETSQTFSVVAIEESHQGAPEQDAASMEGDVRRAAVAENSPLPPGDLAMKAELSALLDEMESHCEHEPHSDLSLHGEEVAMLIEYIAELEEKS